MLKKLTAFGSGDVNAGTRKTSSNAGNGNQPKLVCCERLQTTDRKRRPQYVHRLPPVSLPGVRSTAAVRRRRVLGAELDSVRRYRFDVAGVPAETDGVGRHVGH